MKSNGARCGKTVWRRQKPANDKCLGYVGYAIECVGSDTPTTGVKLYWKPESECRPLRGSLCTRALWRCPVAFSPLTREAVVRQTRDLDS